MVLYPQVGYRIKTMSLAGLLSSPDTEGYRSLQLAGQCWGLCVSPEALCTLGHSSQCLEARLHGPQ